MAYILATTGSVTTATRLAKSMERAGCLDIRVIHTPSNISTGGCSYSVRMPEECKEELFFLEKQGRFKIKKIYRETVTDKEREYDDISG